MTASAAAASGGVAIVRVQSHHGVDGSRSETEVLIACLAGSTYLSVVPHRRPVLLQHSHSLVGVLGVWRQDVCNIGVSTILNTFEEKR